MVTISFAEHLTENAFVASAISKALNRSDIYHEIDRSEREWHGGHSKSYQNYWSGLTYITIPNCTKEQYIKARQDLAISIYGELKFQTQGLPTFESPFVTVTES